MKIRFILMFLLLSVLIIYNTLGQEKKDTVNHAEWHVKDVTSGVDIGNFTTDSVEFIPDFNASGAIIRFYYTDFHGSELAGQYAIAINIKGFSTPGVYQLGRSEGRWRAMDGTICGVSDNDNGQIRILHYDPVQKIVSGDFEFDVTKILTTGDEVHLTISNGKFRMGRGFLLNDINKEAIREKEIEILKVDNINDPTLRTSFGKFKTSKSGWIYLGKAYDVKAEDLLVFQTFLDTVLATKVHHEDVDKIKYYTKLDNIEFDKEGSPVYDTVRYAPATDTIIINHQTIVFNLLISIEWNAKDDYFTALKEWLVKLGEYYYDVSDGQIEFDKIAIYDNKKFWNDADIQIFASNMQWPEAFVNGINALSPSLQATHFTRLFCGNKPATLLNTAKPNWLSFENGFMSRTFGHEFGHYALGFYDEYINAAGVKIHNNYNFGYMDSQFPSSGEYSTEMSSIARYPGPAHKVTKQWATNGSDCWAFFEQNYEKKRKDILSPIITPKERTLKPGKDFQIGPNENGTTDMLVGDKINFIIKNEPEVSSGNYTWQITIPRESRYKRNNWGKIITTTLRQKNGKNTIGQINQGEANTDNYATAPPSGFDNTIIVLGAKIGDQAISEWEYYQHNTVSNTWTRVRTGSVKKTINAVSGIDKGSDYPLLAYDEDEQTGTLDSNQKFVGVWKYITPDKMNFNLTATLNQMPSPEFEVEYNDTTFETVTLENSNNGYSIILDKEPSPNGTHWLNIQTTENDTAMLSVRGLIRTTSEDYFSVGGAFWAHIDTSKVKLEKMAVFNTLLPAMTDGLTDVQLQASDVFSIAPYPNISIFPESSDNYVIIRYDKGMIDAEDQLSLHIFHWNEPQRIWQILESSVDTAMSFVSSPLKESGAYVLFLTDLKVGVNDKPNKINDGGLNIKVTPSVIENEAVVNVYSDKEQRVKIGLYDLMGRKLVNIHDGLISSGKEIYKFNTSELPLGTYFIRIIGENGFAVAKVIKNK